MIGNEEREMERACAVCQKECAEEDGYVISSSWCHNSSAAGTLVQPNQTK